jgi:hypothetical protein
MEWLCSEKESSMTPKFIVVENSRNGSEIYINVNFIVAISRGDAATLISVSDGDTDLYEVADSVQHVLEYIKDAS